jgi:hypothetical protein
MLAEAIDATRSQVVAALRQASAATGSDFDYLLGTAMRESSLKPAAHAATSSASGLFQFTQQTWLGMVKQHGAQFGLGSYADTISRGSDGRYHVHDHADRQAILALRNDPKTAALMAGEYAQDTRCQLKGELGRDVCSGELYAAHFLGPAAACKLIRMNQSHPGANAASAFPDAAGSNRSVFYHRNGTAKTVGEVYGWAMKQPALAKSLAGVSQAAPAVSSAQPVSAPANDDSFACQLWDATDPSAAAMIGGVGHGQFALTPGIVHVLASLSPEEHDDLN